MKRKPRIDFIHYLIIGSVVMLAVVTISARISLNSLRKTDVQYADTNQPPIGILEPVHLDTGTVTGWARDPDTNDPILVQFFLDGIPNILFPNRYIGATTANVSRPDLIDINRTHGFSFQLPARLQDGLPHKIYAYAIDSVQGSSPQLTDSPAGFIWTVETPSPSIVPSTSPSPTPNHLPTGNLDTLNISTGAVTGWARDPDTTEPIIVQFFLDGIPNILHPERFLGEARADIRRPDLPFPDKDHGFNFQLPARLHDGLQHTLYAFAIDSAGGNNPALPGTPLAFRMPIPSPTPVPSPSVSLTPSPTPTPSPSPTPSPIAYGCNNMSFFTISNIVKDPQHNYPATKDCLKVPNYMYLNENRFTFFITPGQITEIPFVKTENVGIKEDPNLSWSVTMTVPSDIYLFYRKIPGQVPPHWISDSYQRLTNDDFTNLNQFLLRKNDQGLIGVYDIYLKHPVFTDKPVTATENFGPASDNVATAYSMYLVGVKPRQ